MTRYLNPETGEITGRPAWVRPAAAIGVIVLAYNLLDVRREGDSESPRIGISISNPYYVDSSNKFSRNRPDDDDEATKGSPDKPDDAGEADEGSPDTHDDDDEAPKTAGTGQLSQLPIAMKGPDKNGYYQLQPAPNGEYEISDHSPPKYRCGSKKLVEIVHKVAVAFGQRFPDEKLRIGDLNGPRSVHKTHNYGNAVDFYTTNTKHSGDYPGAMTQPERAIALGEMLVDVGEGEVTRILYQDKRAEAAIEKYAGKQLVITTVPNHYNHFHVIIDSKHKGPQARACDF